MKGKQIFLLIFTALVISITIGACASSDSAGVAPTALPYESSGQPLDGVSSEPGDAAAGRAVFETHCIACHATEDATVVFGPSLAKAGNRLQFDYVQNSVTNPHEYRASALSDEADMQDNLGDILTKEELDNVTAYVLSLK